MEFFITALAAFSVLSLCLHFLQGLRRRFKALTLLGIEEGEDDREKTRSRHGLLSSARRAITLLGEAFPEKAGGGAADLLEESGSAWTPSFLRGLRLALTLACVVLALPLGSACLLLCPLLSAAAYHAPVLVLKRQARRRREELANDLPEMVDLMAVLCFAGEGLHAALEHALRACGHPSTRAAMQRIVERIKLGESVSEALRRAASHPGSEMRRFCRTLLRADEGGAPIADILEELAVEFRNARRERERVRAARISIYILFPLVFMILPSFMLLTVGGIILGNAM